MLRGLGYGRRPSQLPGGGYITPWQASWWRRSARKGEVAGKSFGREVPTLPDLAGAVGSTRLEAVKNRVPVNTESVRELVEGEGGRVSEIVHLVTMPMRIPSLR